MLKIGQWNNYTCPICDCDNHFFCEDIDIYPNNDDTLTARYSLRCEECNSFFSLTETLKTKSIKAVFEIELERHDSEYGEGKYF